MCVAFSSLSAADTVSHSSYRYDTQIMFTEFLSAVPMASLAATQIMSTTYFDEDVCVCLSVLHVNLQECTQLQMIIA